MNINTVSREELVRNPQLDGATAAAIARAREKYEDARRDHRERAPEEMRHL